ncbi:hypothetical protein ACN28C_20885 [Plantactinospora sp. WMMC1484]|uniref:hypothetical protein n=1 Tax=Plantactinospora sp. WMMC1484 TaxID=3404122 RepID=UPI003BF5EF0B
MGVLELRDGAGATWFVKGHGDPEHYRRELTAYRRWVPDSVSGRRDCGRTTTNGSLVAEELDELARLSAQGGSRLFEARELDPTGATSAPGGTGRLCRGVAAEPAPADGRVTVRSVSSAVTDRSDRSAAIGRLPDCRGA